MADIEQYQEEITEMVNNLAQQIDKIAQKEPSQRDKIISKCRSQIDDIQSRIEEFQFEVYEVSSKEKMQQYNSQVEKFKEEVSMLEKRIEQAKNAKFLENTLQANEKFERQIDGEEALIQVGKETQKKGLESLKRVRLLVDDANSMATDINAELIRQLEQLDKADDNLKEASTNITRANTYISWFAKEMMKDNFIRYGVIIVIMLILAVIALKVRAHVKHLEPTVNIPDDLVLKAYSQPKH